MLGTDHVGHPAVHDGRAAVVGEPTSWRRHPVLGETEVGQIPVTHAVGVIADAYGGHTDTWGVDDSGSLEALLAELAGHAIVQQPAARVANADFDGA